MLGIELAAIDEDYIIARFSDDKPEVWQAPRGINNEDPQARWGINPDHAYVYKTLDAVSTAVRRLKISYPNEFINIRVVVLNDYKREYGKREYSCISELLTYHPKATKLYVLEHDNRILFFATEDDRQQIINHLSQDSYSLYDLRFL
jgi:hypothetical protein